MGGIVKQRNHRQLVTLTNIVIVEIMGWSDFHTASAEFLINIAVGNNCNTPIHNGQFDELTD